MSIETPTKTLPSSITIPNFIKRIGKILQLFSSKLTVLFVHKLFITPVKFSLPEREKMMLKSSQVKRVKIHKLNTEIEVLSYGYSKKKVLLIHGWAGRSTQLFMVADRLLEKGYMIISFDGPAHGHSEGKTTNLLDFLDVIEQINTEFGPFVAGVGHSFGGICLYNAANSLNLKTFVTIGAGDYISNIINRFISNMSLKPKIARKLVAFFKDKWHISVDEYSSSKKAKDLKMPVLVIHDTLDGDVPVSCATNIRQSLQNGTLLLTQGLGHTKILRDKKLMYRVVEFITNNS